MHRGRGEASSHLPLSQYILHILLETEIAFAQASDEGGTGYIRPNPGTKTILELRTHVKVVGGIAQDEGMGGKIIYFFELLCRQRSIYRHKLVTLIFAYIAVPSRKLAPLIAPTEHFAILPGHRSVKWARIGIEDHRQEVMIGGPER